MQKINNKEDLVLDFIKQFRDLGAENCFSNGMCMEDVNDYETGKIPIESYDEKQAPIEWDIREPFPENVPSGTMIIAVRK